MALKGKNVLIGFEDGGFMGIGEAIARQVTAEGANLALFARSKVIFKAIDLQSYEAVETAVNETVNKFGTIDILINNAGLALGAPAAFLDLKPSDIVTMNSTNINGLMFVTYAVLNSSMLSRKEGTILNITSVTSLEVPPFSGEALNGTNVRVLALRPGIVATNFHSLRVGHDKEKYDSFIEGYTADDIAGAAIYMLNQPLRISVKTLDVVPSAQRPLTVFDRSWTERNA
ncbi:hypothetical protein BJX70DRAFT_392500 [Aspergillus crustosus]